MINLSNTAMEASVLGVILTNNELLYSAIDVLNENCFVEGLHRDIFNCIKQLLEQGERVTPLRLYNKFAKELGEQNKGYINSLPATGNVAALRSNIKHLADLAHRREISSICRVTLDSLESFDKTGLEQAAQLLDSATKIVSSSSSDTSIGIVEAMDRLYKEMVAEKPAYQAKTGLQNIDLGTGGGLQRGRVYAFMAAAKVGKTMLATTISNHLNQQGNKHLFVCAEMGSGEICQRMLGQRLGVPANAFMDNGNKSLQEKAGREIGALKRNTIFEDVPGVELETLKSLIELHVFKNKIEGFILDYYQLVGGCERGQTQAQHLENVANWIHRVCKRHKIWCILLVQTNDESKVLGSRGLNRACDQGYLIERPLDDQGDPKGNGVWLKLRFSRYTRTCNLGSEALPCFQIHPNGTHFKELFYNTDNIQNFA